MAGIGGVGAVTLPASRTRGAASPALSFAACRRRSRQSAAASADRGRRRRRSHRPRCLDDADAGPVRGKHPDAAGACAEDPSGCIDLHAVRNAVRSIGGHIGEHPPTHHFEAGIQFNRVDILGPARVRDVQGAFVRRQHQAIRILEKSYRRHAAVWCDAVDGGVFHLAFRQRHTAATDR